MLSMKKDSLTCDRSSLKRRRRKNLGSVNFIRPLLVLLVNVTSVKGEPPIALHHLYEVKPSGNIVISLMGYDIDGDKTRATITSLPQTGQLYHLTKVFDDYGYDPKKGVPIKSVPMELVSKKSRVLYVRPQFDRELYTKWDSFNYTVSDKESMSYPGTVVLVGPSRTLVGSQFHFDAEEWTVTGNLKANVLHEPTSMGTRLSHYIYATEDLRNVDENGDDRNLWYFTAPHQFTGWHGLLYDGFLEFSLSSFSGQFTKEDFNFGGSASLVLISCIKCDHGTGRTIGFPLSSVSPPFDGSTTDISLKMSENGGWVFVKYGAIVSENSIKPTKCEMIEVLSSISSVKILGDMSQWYETISIDNVRYVTAQTKGRKQLPPCVQKYPNAVLCSCKL